MTEPGLKRWVRGLAESRTRGLVWIQGSRPWTLETLRNFLHTESVRMEEGRLLTDEPEPGIPCLDPRRAADLLGQTVPWVAIDAYAGFNPNAFAQVCGTVAAGGWLFLLTPPDDQWVNYKDPEYRRLCVEPWRADQLEPVYLRRFVRQLQAQTELVVFDEQGVHIPSTIPLPESTAALPSPYRSVDQQAVVERLIAVLDKRCSAAVIDADRGRGKSSALGILLSQLAAGRGPQRVILTAPKRASLSSAFDRIEEACGALDWHDNRVCLDGLELRFVQPAEVLEHEADLLIVDEAAAIATPLLSAYARRFRHLIFSTTQHGYEGNGRGFTLRFLSELKRIVPELTQLYMQTPIRWGAGDPLEAVSNRLLLLDAEPAEPVVSAAENIEYRTLSRAELAADESLLRALFGLLVLAHYRTTPGDLRVLLDSPNIHFELLYRGGSLVGCAAVAAEGGLSRALAEGVWAGVRRPTGHLLPQALIAHEGALEFAPMSAWRIMRIAVHPRIQSQGLGAALVSRLGERARQAGIDYLGASFGATAGLVQFWRRQGFRPVRVGDQRDPVSSSFATLVLHPLSRPASEAVDLLEQRYCHSVKYRLSGTLMQLPAPLLPVLLGGVEPPSLDARQRHLLQGFAQTHRSLESCLLELDLLLTASVPRWSELGLSDADMELLVNRIWRQQPAGALSEPGGRRAQLARLRALIGGLLQAVSQ